MLHGGALPRKLERHDIGLLLEKLADYRSDMDDFKVRAESLSDFATMYRYPGAEVEPLTQEVVETAIADATLFLDKARELILAWENDGNGDGAGGLPPIRKRSAGGPSM